MIELFNARLPIDSFAPGTTTIILDYRYDAGNRGPRRIARHESWNRRSLPRATRRL